MSEISKQIRIKFTDLDGKEMSILAGANYDASATADFYLSLHQLMQQNSLHWQGDVSARQLRPFTENVLGQMQDPEVDINGIKIEPDNFLVPFFYQAFANTPKAVFTAYYNNRKTDFRPQAGFAESGKTISLVDFIARIDEARCRRFPERPAIRDMRQAYRLACSIFEQPIIAQEEGGQYAPLAASSFSRHRVYANSCIAQRVAFSAAKERARMEETLGVLADTIGYAAFPDATTSGSGAIAKKLKSEMIRNLITSQKALENVPSDRQIDHARFAVAANEGVEVTPTEKLVCAKQYTRDILFLSATDKAILRAGGVAQKHYRPFRRQVARLAEPILNAHFAPEI